MMSVAEAQARILAAFPPLPAETIGVGDSLGRVLAEPVLARVTAPPVAVSAMDGYAVRAADFERRPPYRLHVIAEVAAGSAFRGVVQPREAVRIFTGAPMPAGTNAVIVQETARLDDDGYINPIDGVAEGHYVRPAGLDFSAGALVLPAGKVITARDIGLIAAMNVPWLRVRQRPRVAVLATGDELVLPGEPLGPHQIIGSNTLALMALVSACGGVPVNLGIARDNAESLLGSVAAAEGTDLLVTSGGASVGDYDLVRRLLGSHGHALDSWQVAMRPGKPLIFGRAGSVPLLGLPGNPVSALVSAIVFLRPALAALLGQPPVEAGLRPTARLGQPLPANDGRQTYLRGLQGLDHEGRLTATAFIQQDSAVLTVMAAADCLIVRPPDAPAAAVGERVEILHLGDGIAGV